MHGVSEEKSRLTSFSLWVGNIKLFSITSFSFLFSVSVPFQSFFSLFMTWSSVSFLVFLLLFNRSASVLCSNSFGSLSVRSPASSASGEFTGKFTVYSSPRNRFLMGLSTLRSIWTTIHWQACLFLILFSVSVFFFLFSFFSFLVFRFLFSSFCVCMLLFLFSVFFICFVFLLFLFLF